MSLFSYSEEFTADMNETWPGIFFLPLLVRSIASIKYPFLASSKKCYYQLSLLSVTLFIFKSWPSYFTYLSFAFILDIFLLSVSTVNAIAIPNFLELFNLIAWCGLFCTPLCFWASIGIVWGLNMLKNLGSNSFIGIILAFVQIITGVLAVLAANNNDLQIFQYLLLISLALMLGQVEAKLA